MDLGVLGILTPFRTMLFSWQIRGLCRRVGSASLLEVKKVKSRSSNGQNLSDALRRIKEAPWSSNVHALILAMMSSPRVVRVRVYNPLRSMETQSRKNEGGDPQTSLTHMRLLWYEFTIQDGKKVRESS
eukprot:scaffold53_cov381-Pavlova_lutheri.AAC.21